MVKNTFVSVFLCILLGSAVLGLDERSAKEKRCSKSLPKASKKIDVDWAQSISTWYITHTSRLEIYRMAADVKHVPTSEIKEDDLYYSGCFKVLWEKETHPIVQGFHGKKSETVIKQVKEGVLKYNPSNYEFSGIGVLTLTDNKTFQFVYKCYDDGEATWAVLSTVEDLNNKTKKIILDHARSLGFNEKYFTEMEFETCKESNGGKNEL